MAIEIHEKPTWLSKPKPFTIWPITDTNPYVKNEQTHTVQFYELIWIFCGSGYRVIDGTAYTLKPNRIFFMRPLSTHQWKKASGLHGVFLLFSEEYLHEITAGKAISLELPFFSTIQGPPYIDLPSHNMSQGLLDFIEKALIQDSEFSSEKIQKILSIIFMECTEQMKEPFFPKKETLVSKFESLLESTPPLQHPSDFAEKIGYSPNYCNDKIKKETGKPIGWWIRQRKLQEAKKHLLFSERSISSIAKLLNFEDISYFCRFFKKHTGLTPLQFRNSQ